MYATRADMAARFGATEMDSIAPADDQGASRADSRLVDAAAEIDAALYPVFELPLPAGPWPLLRAISCDIARLHLYDDEAPQRVWRGAAEARSRLKMLLARRGTGLVDEAGSPAPRRALAQATAPEPALGRGALSDA